MDNSDSTVPSSGHAPLIAAAWKQVEGLRGPLRSSSVDPNRTAAPAAGDADEFPGYRVLEEIERGGQGVVYKALQESTQRVVAIKLLRDRVFLAESDIQRFQQEVRVLGSLRHANIVRIYDSLAADRRFYYVMDYIPGLPLDAYVGSASRSLPEIVRLFVKICDAINSAHLRGIIHRDLKPGNIRVDPEGEPFVLDFGLSKLCTPAAPGRESSSAAPGREGSSAALGRVDVDVKDSARPGAAGLHPAGLQMTQDGQFIGSMPWAAPEQAAGKLEAIDVRTDVYSLGVLLYQMLTGTFPYTVRGPVNEVLSQIISAEAAAPRTSNPAIPIDLETIVLKCLQKAPERRYQSAREVGRDLERFLAGEPIEARRDSLTYVLGKKLARYRLAAYASAAVLIATAGGLALSLSFWRQAEAARADAVAKGTLASQNEVRARQNAEHAALESAAARAVADFLTEMFTSVDPYKGGSHDVRVADTLDTAARRLDGGALAGQPELEARVRRVLGKAYASLGLNELGYAQAGIAVDRFEEARGAGSEEALRAMVDWLALQRRISRPAEGEPLARGALGLTVTMLGPDHEATLGMMNELGATLMDLGAFAEAERLWRDAIERSCLRLGDDYPERLAMINNLAYMLWQRGRLEEAQALFEPLIDQTRRVLGETHPAYATRMVNLALVYERRGRLSEAEGMYEKALVALRRIHGDHHPELAGVMINLADLYRVQQRFTKAETAARETLAFCERVLPPGDINIAKAAHNLGAALYSLERLDEALEVERRAIEIFTATLGPDHDSVLGARGVLAAIQFARGDLRAAEDAMREIYTARLRRFGAGDQRTLRSYCNLGEIVAKQGKLAEAEAIFRATLARRRARLGETHPETLTCAVVLAQCLSEQGALEQGESLMRETLSCLRDSRLFGNTADAGAKLADMLAQQGRFDDSEELLRESIQTAGRAMPADHPELARIRANLGVTLLRLGRADDALAELSAALAVLREKLGDDDADVRDLREEIADIRQETGRPAAGPGPR
ncbi:Serine/threonine-protein kinase Pkn1 [Phycisphaerae bacterium RAS1]|nr:Serine/threonine-protein kinase Pkn1 [Phycisphaerae bacterium RAS1]